MTTRPAPVRLSVNMNPETAEALEKFAKSKGISITEAMRRIIAIAHFIQSEVRSGNALVVQNSKTGLERELILL